MEVSPSGTSHKQGHKHNGSKHSQNHRSRTYCYGCRDPSHLLPDCPHKASLKIAQLHGGSPGMVIDGTISGVFCSDILVDSGAEVTVVHTKVVTENAYMGRTILMSCFRNRDNDFTECSVACVQIKVGGVCGHFEVAVCDGI